MSYGKRGWERTEYSLWGRAATSPAPSGPEPSYQQDTRALLEKLPVPLPHNRKSRALRPGSRGPVRTCRRTQPHLPRATPPQLSLKLSLGAENHPTLWTLRLKAQVSPGEINADCKPPLSTPGLNQRRPTHTKMRSPPQEMAGQEQNEFPFCGNGVTHGLYYGLGSCLPSTEQALS